jgi:hypothetical protein
MILSLNVTCEDVGLYTLKRRCGTQDCQPYPICGLSFRNVQLKDVNLTNFSVIVVAFEYFSTQYIYGCCNFIVTKSNELLLCQKCQDYFTLNIIS